MHKATNSIRETGQQIGSKKFNFMRGILHWRGFCGHKYFYLSLGFILAEISKSQKVRKKWLKRMNLAELHLLNFREY